MTIDSNMGMRPGIGFFWSHKDKYCFKVVVVNKEGGAMLALACLLEKEVLMWYVSVRITKDEEE